MSTRFRFTPAAEQDVEAAFDWYNDRRSGLGNEFLDELHATLGRITENPSSGPVIRRRSAEPF